MHSFWEQQERARSRSATMWALFVATIATIWLVIYLPVVVIYKVRELSVSSLGWLWSGEVAAWTAGPLLLIVGTGTAWEMVRLRKGGAGLARQLKARRLETAETPEERRLLNVVEEISIASGVPLPPIYVLERAKKSLNALVAGNTIDDAAIIVTRGCVDQLSRDELQVLVAHEFSHIFNGDMQVNLRAMSLVYGISCLALVGFELMFPDEDFGCLSVALGLPLVLLGGIGACGASLIQKCLGREREFLADASAVQFTRHPDGLLSLIDKVQAGSSRVPSSSAAAADHLFFATSRRPAWIPWFRTHPPLPERRRRVEQMAGVGAREGSPLAQALTDAARSSREADGPAESGAR